MKIATVTPRRTSTVRETITLASRKATVTRIPVKYKATGNLEWLMRDVLSTPYSTIIE